MLDFGFTELLLIGAVLILIVGPKQIPEIMYNFGRIMRRLTYMRFALSRQFEDFMHDMDVSKTGDEATDSLNMLPREKNGAVLANQKNKTEDGAGDEEEDEDFLEPIEDAAYPAAKTAKQEPET
jgi:Sec-independent protein translocase protein TatA|tara:strand:- start:78207 stop:78578 length:372 start_codon:yes stop_codon:yes gene_type:complete